MLIDTRNRRSSSVIIAAPRRHDRVGPGDGGNGRVKGRDRRLSDGLLVGFEFLSHTCLEDVLFAIFIFLRSLSL